MKRSIHIHKTHREIHTLFEEATYIHDNLDSILFTVTDEKNLEYRLECVRHEIVDIRCDPGFDEDLIGAINKVMGQYGIVPRKSAGAVRDHVRLLVTQEGDATTELVKKTLSINPVTVFGPDSNFDLKPFGSALGYYEKVYEGSTEIFIIVESDSDIYFNDMTDWLKLAVMGNIVGSEVTHVNGLAVVKTSSSNRLRDDYVMPGL